jgi:hypothetical protein
VTPGQIARRAVVAGWIVAQLVLVVRAYGAPQDPYGFQMFPESSTWRAEIVRVTPGGSVPVAAEWPGGYRWDQLVPFRGFGDPGVDHHATAGIDSTLDFLQKALDYAASHTPEDTETLRLSARVTYRRNGGPPQVVVLESMPRSEAAP